MFSNFDFSVILNSWRYLFLDGMAFTLTLTALAAVGGVILIKTVVTAALLRFAGARRGVPAGTAPLPTARPTGRRRPSQAPARSSCRDRIIENSSAKPS